MLLGQPPAEFDSCGMFNQSFDNASMPCCMQILTFAACSIKLEVSSSKRHANLTFAACSIKLGRCVATKPLAELHNCGMVNQPGQCVSAKAPAELEVGGMLNQSVDDDSLPAAPLPRVLKSSTSMP